MPLRGTFKHSTSFTFLFPSTLRECANFVPLTWQAPPVRWDHCWENCASTAWFCRSFEPHAGGKGSKDRTEDVDRECSVQYVHILGIFSPTHLTFTRPNKARLLDMRPQAVHLVFCSTTCWRTLRPTLRLNKRSTGFWVPDRWRPNTSLNLRTSSTLFLRR